MGFLVRRPKENRRPLLSACRRRPGFGGRQAAFFFDADFFEAGEDFFAGAEDADNFFTTWSNSPLPHS